MIQNHAEPLILCNTEVFRKTTMSDEFAIIRDADTKSEDMVKEILENQLNSNLDSEFASKAISKRILQNLALLKVIYFLQSYL